AGDGGIRTGELEAAEFADATPPAVAADQVTSAKRACARLHAHAVAVLLEVFDRGAATADLAYGVRRSHLRVRARSFGQDGERRVRSRICCYPRDFAELELASALRARVHSVAMERVLGVGGTSLQANDPAKLKAWYRDQLGL